MKAKPRLYLHRAAGKAAPGRLAALMQEGDEIVSIVVASIKTARLRS